MTNPSFPEAKARKQIDRMLADAGWVVQDRADFNPAAATGIAVREFPLKTGFADYLLLVDRMAVGAVEAKKMGTPLSGVESQSAKYSDGLPDIPPAWRKPLPFLYESTGVETFFTNGLDPDPRSRQLFAFHRAETLRVWVKKYRAENPDSEPPLTVSERARLAELEREVRELKLEREFLGKAAAFFAKEYR